MKAYNQAFFTKDIAQLTMLLANDVHWHAIGQQQLSGRQAVIEALSQAPALRTIDIASQLFGDNEVAQFGTLETQDNERYYFADRYIIADNGLIAEVHSVVSFI